MERNMTHASAAEVRRAAILAAAIHVLSSEGINDTTTRKIAAAAGINQATLLYHVGSKDELLLAVLREMMRLTGEVARRVLIAGLSPRAAIRHSITAFWQHVEATPELQVMQYELTLYALRHGGSAWLAREQYAGYGAVVEELLRETFTAAGARCALPFPALARFIVGGLDGLILQFISDRHSVRARRDLETLIAAVIALAEGAAPSLGAEESVGTQAQRD
jgi:AcrR family transcriptional regulator